MSRGFFVTGTDTGIGKTTISCALLHAFAALGKRVVGMKPIAAGIENGRCMDIEQLQAASNLIVSCQHINSYVFHPSISPHIAAQKAGIEIDLAVIHKAYLELSMKADIVIVEGAGGFLVPISQSLNGSDLAQTLNLPIILVVGMKLGCLNHALLTAQAVQAAGLVLAGWVANCIDPQMIALTENLKTLEQRLNCPFIGTLPFINEVVQHRGQVLDINELISNRQFI